jgi:hypothetical protein
MKNILIVTNAFYPENSPRSLRATELSVELSKQGHFVTVITHPRVGIESFCETHNIRFKSLGLLSWPFPKIKGTGLILLFWRVIVRLSTMFFEYPFIQIIPLLKKALKGESGYDMLISVAVPYPIHWGVASVRTNKNPIAKIWVADCGDPYMGQENDTFKPPFYFGWIEKWFCRKADYLTVPFDGAIKSYYKEFHHKIKVVPQGLTFPVLNKQIKTDKIPTFGYAGNISSYMHYATPFFHLLNTLDVDFKFVIYTNDKERYTQILNEKTLLKCEFNNYIERFHLLNELNKVDFLVHFPYVVQVQKSLKLVDYHYLNKPILSFVADEFSKQKLMQFLMSDYKNKLNTENIDCYRIENVANQFIQLIQKSIN